MLLTPGNTGDHKAARTCQDAMFASAYVTADKVYNSAALRG